jgi:hypothetical protein
MSHWKLVKLDFGRNLVHFGELGIGMEALSERAYSDTLFSAWVSSYARSTSAATGSANVYRRVGVSATDQRHVSHRHARKVQSASDLPQWHCTESID